MKTKHTQTILLLSMILMSWNYYQVSNKQVIINIIKQVNPKLNLETNEIGFTNYLKPAQKFPILNNEISATFKGIPTNDSIAFFVYYNNGSQYRYDLYKSNRYDKKNFLQDVKRFRIDTLKLSQKPLNQSFVTAIGFYKKRQFIIADFNNNRDFSDDLKYDFSIRFRENPIDSTAILSKLPISTYKYEIFENNSIIQRERKIVLYPTIDEPRLTDDDIFNKIEYNTKCIFRDYWKGKYTIANKSYDLYFQGFDNKRGVLFVKNKKIDLTKVKEIKQYAYSSRDTINIEKKRFVLDSLNYSLTKLYLREVGKMNKNYGVTNGYYLENFLVNEINGGDFKLYSLLSQKKYTIIDFWNTKCAPCVGAMPKLVQIKLKYPNVNILSISNDKSIEEARKGISKYNMNWHNSYYNPRLKTSLDRKLRITVLPTLLLVDNKGKIVYRGVSLTEVLNILNK